MPPSPKTPVPPPPATDPPALFPLFVDLRGRPVLVVGGGGVAARKVAALLEAGARVRVVAPALALEVAALAAAGRVEHVAARFEPGHLDGAWLAIAASDDAVANRAVAETGARRGTWVNVVDDAAATAVHLPAIVRRGPLQVAISSGGGAPMLARHLREVLEAQLDESWGRLAALLARHRRRIRARFANLGARRDFLRELLAGPLRDLLRERRDDDAERALSDALRRAPQRHAGRVALVGAGPGDPGLLTLRALRLLNEADVILHDRLVDDAVLALARRDAERIDVGKTVGGDHAATQRRIHALLVERARAGQRVVRLKGGDPFVFGRGGEELEALHAAGIPFEVVPGITAALAAGAYAGIPLTHRGHAQSLQLLTAHGRDGLPASLPAPGATLAVYMGIAALAPFRDALLARGHATDTPFALVENATRPTQRVVLGRLDQLPELARAHRVRAPALLVVGDVAAHASRLHWYGAPPLGAPDASTAGADLPAAA